MNKVSNQQKKLCCRCQKKKKKKKIFKVKKKLKIENINSMFRCSKLTLDDEKKKKLYILRTKFIQSNMHWLSMWNGSHNCSRRSYSLTVFLPILIPR